MTSASDMTFGLLNLESIPHQHLSPLISALRQKKSSAITSTGTPHKSIITSSSSASSTTSEIDKNRKIILNVGGTRFETLMDTLTKHGRNTMLGAMFLSLNSEVKDEYFIDRDPEMFRYILNWYRTGYLTCPQGIPAPVMELELDYFGIPRTELKIYQKQFTLSGKKVWSCKSCGIHIADHRDVHSKNFTGKNGEAILFNSAVNVTQGEPVEKQMLSGKHLVSDIKCNNCGDYVGWTYQKAFTPENKFKEGKSVLEKSCLVKEKNVC